jgi:hypothetical protein
MKRRADDGVDADASLKARSERAVRETLERKRSKARKDADDDASANRATDVNGDKGTTATFPGGMMTFPGRGVDEVARRLNVPLPFRRVTEDETGAADGVGACGAEAKTNADASDVEEDEWDDVDDYDYGAYVPDVELEETVKLEETRDPKAVEEANVGRRKKKVRRLNDEERTALLATHHAHVLCLVA